MSDANNWRVQNDIEAELRNRVLFLENRVTHLQYLNTKLTEENRLLTERNKKLIDGDYDHWGSMRC